MAPHKNPGAVILAAVRTPFGRRGGALRETRPDELLAHVLTGVLERIKLPSAAIGDVIAGCVSQAGEQGANIARQSLLLAGLPVEVPGVSLNRMCGSSQHAVHAAAQAVAAGDVDCAIGCGVENMSRVPMLFDITLGRGEFRSFDGLHPAVRAQYPIPHQGESAELIAERGKLTRAELDDYSRESHRRAHAAQVAGYNREIIPIQAVDKEGARIMLEHDEGIRTSIDEKKMSSLPPAFRPRATGVITAANSSQISDGAAAVIVGSPGMAEHYGLRPKARFRARVVVGSDPVLQLTGVIPATRLALKRAGLALADIDWIEINEAFAAVVLYWMREFNPDREKVNPWGGAIAHGHPLGATGAGLMAKMLVGLEQQDRQFGLQVMCIGHGMATASIIERLA